MKRYLLLALALLFAALNFNLILKPLELVTGGTQGLALLIHSVVKVNPSYIILGINLVTLIASYFLLAKQTTYGALVSTFLYPFFVRITSFLPDFPMIYQYEILWVMIAGIVCGITGGYVYRLGFSSGGVNTINLLVNKYTKLKVAYSNFLINTLIIIFGCFLFGVKKGLYSIIVILFSSCIIYFMLKKYKVE